MKIILEIFCALIMGKSVRQLQITRLQPKLKRNFISTSSAFHMQGMYCCNKQLIFLPLFDSSLLQAFV